MNEQRRFDGSTMARRLLNRVADRARDIMVTDVRIGLGYTAVKLADGRSGVAYTFRDQAQGGCCVFEGLRPLIGRSAADLVPLLESSDAIEAGLGLACVNALVNRPEPTQSGGDILEHLDVRADDDVAMVGNFGPLVGPLQQRARSLTIFERVAAPTGVLRPQGEAIEALSCCTIALITATSLINHTVDGLLEAARACRQVALVGASTPLVADVFEATGVTLLSGVVVTMPDEILRVVSEGGGMRQFSPHVRKVTVRVNPQEPTTRRSRD